MYLGMLNQSEKENFLELTYYIAGCDSDFSSTEKDWILRCRNEMNLQDYLVKNKTLDTIIIEFENTSFISKTLILLEILELMVTDETYHQTEKEVINTLCNKWNIGDEQFRNIALWLKEKNIILDS
jgi:hypothetical protein